jgi:hypothetical protein
MRNTGTERITTGYGGGFSSSFANIYQFSEVNLPPNDTNFTQQWLFINVLPGEVYHFVFGKFIPPAAGAPLGDYTIHGNLFGVGGPTTNRVDFGFRNQFSRMVVVPEPLSLALLGVFSVPVVAHRRGRCAGRN